MNNYEAEVLLRFLFCKLKFDLDLLIGLKNAMKFKDSMPWVRSAFGFSSCFKIFLNRFLSFLIGCIIPCHGGIYYPSDNFSLCLDPSKYNSDHVMQTMIPIMEEMKMPCKLSEILYGPMHTSDSQNRTRLGDCWSS